MDLFEEISWFIPKGLEGVKILDGLIPLDEESMNVEIGEKFLTLILPSSRYGETQEKIIVEGETITIGDVLKRIYSFYENLEVMGDCLWFEGFTKLRGGSYILKLGS